MGLLDFCEEIDRDTLAVEILRPPFGWPGGKQKLAEVITQYLPYRASYIEPFGGSGAILLARHKSPIEVYNDRYGGVVCFYRCLKNPLLFEKLIETLELLPYSREEWHESHDTWENCQDPVERAAKWYHMTVFSFAQMGRNFGRGIKSGSLAHRIYSRLPEFYPLHTRLQGVTLENLDWSQIMDDYDHFDAVTYCDPPYLNAASGCYKNNFLLDDHRKLLWKAFHCKGFVAISGYHNELYDAQPWDQVLEFPHAVSLEGKARGDGCNKAAGLPTSNTRVMECLFIKGARP